MIRHRVRSWAIPIVSSSLLHLGLAWGALGVVLVWMPQSPEVVPVDLVPEQVASPPAAPPRPPLSRPHPVATLKSIQPPTSVPPPRESSRPPEAIAEVKPAPAPVLEAMDASPKSPETSSPKVEAATVAPPMVETKREEAPGASSVEKAPSPAPTVATDGNSRPGIAAPSRESSGEAASPRPSVASVLRPRAPGADVTQSARPRGGYQVIPSYPASARRLGIEGTTLLRVLVLADGRVGEVTIQKSAGHPDLDEAAANAVRRWRFDPARNGAETVSMWVLLPVEFHLKD